VIIEGQFISNDFDSSTHEDHHIKQSSENCSNLSSCFTKLSKKIKMTLTNIVKVTTLNDHRTLSTGDRCPLRMLLKLKWTIHLRWLWLSHTLWRSAYWTFGKFGKNCSSHSSCVTKFYKKINTTLTHMIKVKTMSDHWTLSADKNERGRKRMR